MRGLRNSSIVLLLIFLIGCSTPVSSGKETKIGLLLAHNIDDQGWNTSGYQGLLNVHSKQKVDVFYKEEINTKAKALEAIKEFVKNDVNLVFGHGQSFVDIFMEIKDVYPDVHFITFNGEVSGNNITSLHFKGYAMGFFAGMLASDMSETNTLGVIAAFPTQPEVEGFVEGASFQNKSTKVKVEYVSSWDNISLALEVYERMVAEGIDVFYPAGDGYHVSIIEEVKKDGLFVIGYVSDHSDLGQSTVLTSTIQHVDTLYELVVEQFFQDQLESGNQYFDFAEGVISLGNFSSEVPLKLQQILNDAIDNYIETGKLPNEY